MTIGILTGTVHAGSGVCLMARLRGLDGNLVTQASLSSITYAIRDLTDAVTDSTGSLTISSVIFDSLQQNDLRWRKDSQSRPGPDGQHGYNFRTVMGATLFGEFTVATASPYRVSPSTFQIDVKFTPTSGQAFVQSWQITPLPTYV